jgi:hypothetical protein
MYFKHKNIINEQILNIQLNRMNIKHMFTYGFPNQFMYTVLADTEIPSILYAVRVDIYIATINLITISKEINQEKQLNTFSVTYGKILSSVT